MKFVGVTAFAFVVIIGSVAFCSAQRPPRCYDNVAELCSSVGTPVFAVDPANGGCGKYSTRCEFDAVNCSKYRAGETLLREVGNC